MLQSHPWERRLHGMKGSDPTEWRNSKHETAVYKKATFEKRKMAAPDGVEEIPKLIVGEKSIKKKHYQY